MIRDVEERFDCVGCGYCCIKHPCASGRAAYPAAIARGEVCPALFWNGHRYVCNLMLKAGNTGDFYKWVLHAGLGCRSHQNPWRRDVKERSGDDIKLIRG